MRNVIRLFSILFVIALWAMNFSAKAQTVKVNTAGNVGIGTGTESPVRKLDVRGDVQIVTEPAMWGIPLSARGIIVGQYHSPSWMPTIYGLNTSSYSIGHPSSRANVYGVNIHYYNLIPPGSDVRLKENIRPCASVLSKLRRINTYTYNYKEEYLKKILSEPQQAHEIEYGFLAQELQEIFPEFVVDIDSGMLSIRYIEMIPILTAAINEMQQVVETQNNELQQEIETLKAGNNELQQRIESLENALIACCSKSNQKSTEGNIQQFNLTNPTDADELKVFQNIPNPFNETTIISCYIPESIQKVELCVYDMQGSLLKCFTISERGATSVQIQGRQLEARNNT